MRITLLTSSRADFGIQLPLLRALADDRTMDVRILAFGAHGDPRFGHTVDQIEAADLAPHVLLPPVLDGDAPSDIARAMGRTMEQFSEVWKAGDTDLIIALGDRYEMFSAVAASMPFGIPVAHIHGGETTTGAMDDAFRHGITHMARLHFTAAGPYRERVIGLLGHDRGVYDTGALSIDNLKTLDLLSIAAIKESFGVDMARPTVLVTVHPETMAPERTTAHANIMCGALQAIPQDHGILITMPNADTHGSVLREALARFAKEDGRTVAVESLGTLGYLSCMKHCAYLLGNTSSGYIEASFFPKHVIDLGERQTGRIVTPNIQRVPFDLGSIKEAISRIGRTQPAGKGSPYGDGHAAERMVHAIRSFLNGTQA